MSLLSSIAFVFILDTLLPVKYFTITEISGIPLIFLSFGFVLVMWGLYTSKIRNILRIIQFNIKSKLVYDKRTRFILATILVSVVLYLYFFTFIVWNHLSVEQVRVQTDNYGQRDIPWYLFPMKLGIVGFLGLLFILSYLYKKFEREIFVFAIIAIFAFLAAPYYDDYRFGKYIMVGMVGFSSLLIYRIICYLQTLRLNILVGGVFLGIIVTTSALSLLMYTGFKDILLDNPGYRLIPGENNRFFPTSSEMNFFTVLKNKIINLKTDNIALLNKDYGNGLLSEKLMGFVGIPFERIYHNPLILNASSLPAFFQLLDSDDIRYIIITQEDLKNTIKYTNPTKFAIDNFPRIYEDDNYLVLKVPQLIGPNPNPDVALVYEPDDEIPSLPLSSNLQYDNSALSLNESEHVQIKNNGTVYLFNNETDPITVWSNLERKKINFIEADFKIIQENKPKSKPEIKWKDDTSYFQQRISAQYPNNSLGIKWKDDQSEYSLLLTTAGLELSTKRINGTGKISVLQNQEVSKEPLKWYNIKILLLKQEIIIFVNDIPRFQIARGVGHDSGSMVSKMGVVVNGNTAEFLPLRVEQVSNLSNSYYSNTRNIYYVLSFLAMSKTSYGVFLKSDLSALSKTVILPSDPTNMSNDRLNSYLEYVKNGGKVIVFNSANAVDGIFSKFLSINSTNLATEFSKITYSYNNHNNSINISGKARVLKIPLENDLKIVSFYSDKLNKRITPFSIEKTFPDGGKIIFINSAGFFYSISKSHENDFLKITNMTNLLNLKSYSNMSQTGSDKFKSVHRFSNIEKFIGLMELYGKIKINSSSLIIYNESDRSNNLNLDVDKLIISNKTKKLSFDNVTIKDLKLYGAYTGQINSSGLFSLPSSNSFYEYIDLHMPREFSLKIKMAPREYGGAKISLINQSKITTFNFTDDFEIYIQIGHKFSNRSPSILIKNPEIKLIGNAIIDSPDFSDVLMSGSRFLKINGTISTKFDHVDDFYEKSDKLTETRYITYLKSVDITGSTNPSAENLRIMGDISYRAKNHDIGIPLQKIFSSTENIILIIIVFIICLFVSRFIWSRKLIPKS